MYFKTKVPVFCKFQKVDLQRKDLHVALEINWQNLALKKLISTKQKGLYVVIESD